MIGETIDLEALRSYRLGRVRAQLAARGYAGLLLYDPLNIRYATDTSNMQVWTMHNPTRYALVLNEGPVVLFEFHGSRHLADGFSTIDEVRLGTPWYYFRSGPRVAEMARRWADEIAELVVRHGGGERRLAVDKIDPPGVAALAEHAIVVVDGQELTELARAIKSPVEIAAMKASMAACEAGMTAMRTALRPGITENELWSILHQTNIALGGEWIETRLLASGPRTNPWFHECSDRVIEAGDAVVFDTDLVGPYGYCADISRAWVAGDAKPGDDFRRLYQRAYEQVHRNIELLRPGLSYREFSQRAVALPEPFDRQRYSVLIHGVGLCDEYPDVDVPDGFAKHGYDGQFEANMTICVESYVGAPGGTEGIKLEEQVLITETGAVPLSSYPYEVDLL